MSDLVSEVKDTEATRPVVIHEGRYRLYGKPDGGLHIVYQRDDSDTPDHMEFPGAIVAMAKAASEGKLSPTDMLREMMKMRNGHVL
jgi:hypothetical protein